jgi:hypothetical protein
MVSAPVTVEFEYQLEVNGGLKPEFILGKIDEQILDELQMMLPNKGFIESSSSTDTDSNNTTSNKPSNSLLVWHNTEIPNVRFREISSQVYSPCFTSSDECGLVKSTIVIYFDGFKPTYSIERIAIRLIQEYLQWYDDNQKSRVSITYLYPFLVTNSIQFILSPVTTEMTDIEKQVMEQTFMDVFGVIVDTVEGDTRIIDSNFLYQAMTLPSIQPEEVDVQISIPTNSSEEQRNGNITKVTIPNDPIETKTNTTTMTITMIQTENQTQTPPPRPPQYTLETNFQMLGTCRDCSKTEYTDMVNTIIEANVEAYRIQLIRNGATVNTTYFDNITNIEFGIPTLPQFLDPTNYENLYDGEAPTTDEPPYPWFLYFGVGLTFCILVCGGCFIRRELKFYAEEDEKDDSAYSTSSETHDPESIVGTHHSRSMESGGGRGGVSTKDDDATKSKRTNSSSSHRLDPAGMIYEYSIDAASEVGDSQQMSLDEYQVETILSVVPDESTVGSNAMQMMSKYTSF